MVLSHLKFNKDIFVGLDVGTSSINTVVAKVEATQGELKPQIIGVGASRSGGLRRGIVTDIDEVVSSIKKSISEAERVSGVKIERAYVSIGGGHIQTLASRGVVAVSRADGEISNEDVERVIAASEAISLPLNREILHVIPRSFTVDSETGIKNPVGMNGVRLEVDTLIISGSSPFVKNLIKCVNESGINIDGLVLNILASSMAILDRRQKDLGVICLDIGGGTSSLAVYEDGELMHVHVLPIGASHVTNDLAIGLRTAIDIAEKVKVEYGSCLPDEINKKDMIDLTKFGLEDEGLVSRKEVAEIIEARILEILSLTIRELKKINRDRLLPAGIITFGGGAKLPGFIDLAKKELKLPAQLGFPMELDGITDRVDDPGFATAVGLVLWGMDSKLGGGSVRVPLSLVPSVSNTIGKMKKWLESFMP